MNVIEVNLNELKINKFKTLSILQKVYDDNIGKVLNL